MSNAFAMLDHSSKYRRPVHPETLLSTMKSPRPLESTVMTLPFAPHPPGRRHADEPCREPGSSARRRRSAGRPVRHTPVLIPSVPAVERAGRIPNSTRAAFRQADRCELYSPSRRSSRPISPGVSQTSARSAIESLRCGVKCFLVAFAKRPAAALRLPSSAEEGGPFISIPSPCPILHLSASAYSTLFLRLCLADVGMGRRGNDDRPSEGTREGAGVLRLDRTPGRELADAVRFYAELGGQSSQVRPTTARVLAASGHKAGPVNPGA